MAILVVCLHSTVFSDINTELSFVVESGLCRIAVPFFFIVNGYFFTRISSTTELLVWIKRGVVLYVIWTLFYGLISPPNSFLGFIYNFVVGWHHLWYLSAMIEACVLVYIFRNKQTLGVVVSTTLFIIGTLIQYAGNYEAFNTDLYNQMANANFLYRNGLFVGFPFCFIGYLLGQHRYNLPMSRTKHLCLAITSVVLLMFESWINYCNPANTGGFDTLFSLLIATPILFLLIMRYNVQGTSKKIALVATSIYLIHPLWRIAIEALNSHSYLNITSTPKAIICVILSIITSYILIKINDRVKYIL